MNLLKEGSECKRTDWVGFSLLIEEKSITSFHIEDDQVIQVERPKFRDGKIKSRAQFQFPLLCFSHILNEKSFIRCCCCCLCVVKGGKVLTCTLIHLIVDVLPLLPRLVRADARAKWKWHERRVKVKVEQFEWFKAVLAKVLELKVKQISENQTQQLRLKQMKSCWDYRSKLENSTEKLSILLIVFFFAAV